MGFSLRYCLLKGLVGGPTFAHSSQIRELYDPNLVLAVVYILMMVISARKVSLTCVLGLFISCLLRIQLYVCEKCENHGGHGVGGFSFVSLVVSPYMRIQHLRVI